MSIIWSAFRAAVNHAIDERNKEARRTRALERIADELAYWNDQTRMYEAPREPTKGNP